MAAPPRTKPTWLSKAATYVGLNQKNAELVLRRAHVESHKEKLAPLFNQKYLDELSSKSFEEPLPQTEKYLKHALNVPLITVTNLNVEPGQKHFIVWLCVSSYFPLISACLAPLGNLISLVALIEHWRIDLNTEELVGEDTAAKVLNWTAFVAGIIGNVSLLMNFSGTLRYLVTQSVLILCWISAASMLLIAVLLTNASFVGGDVEYRRSEGFWLAVWTIFMYYSCSIVQLINLIGYKLKKYPACYNLDQQQRLLINYTMVFAIWQAIGTAVMKHLIGGLSYGASLYYCVVSVFTVGLGDIHPVSTGAKVVALIFSFVGIINLGMVVTTIIRVVVHSAGPSVFWHHVEVRRLKLLDRYERNPEDPIFQDSFQLMRDMREGVNRRQIRFNGIMSLFMFVGFWQIGSVVLYVAEDWTYFNSMYFCFLCLLTIGYGDFAPASVFGRAFFIQWAMGAVPLMTIIISTVADAAFNTGDRIELMLKLLLQWRTSDEAELQEDLESPSPKESTTPTSSQDPTQNYINKTIADLEILEAIVLDALEQPHKQYTYDEWSSLLQRFHLDTQNAQDAPWVNDASPLRLPLKEPHYLLMNMFSRMKHDLEHLHLKQELPEFKQKQP